MIAFNGKVVQYVLNVDDPSNISQFYIDVLGMKVYRHDEYHECCSTCFCEGPLQNIWSRTIFGYWREIDGFTIEVIYNRNRGDKIKENQFIGITIRNSKVPRRAQRFNYPIIPKLHKSEIISPGGYSFFVIKEPKIKNKDPVLKITLASSDLNKTIDYWHCLLGMKIFSHKKKKSAVLGFDDKGVKVKFVQVNKRVTRGSNHLRITAKLDDILGLEKIMVQYKQVLPVPLQKLKIDNSTTLIYLLLSDPDGHSIFLIEEGCFVKAFSSIDSNARRALEKFIISQKIVNEERAFSDLSVLAEHCYNPVITEEEEFKPSTSNPVQVEEAELPLTTMKTTHFQ